MLNVSDLNLEQLTITVIRKGGQQDTVPIAPWGLPYLQDYVQIRQQRYLAANERALFVTKYRGQAKRISNYAIEKLVAKYSEAFGVRLTPHKIPSYTRNRSDVSDPQRNDRSDPIGPNHHAGHPFVYARG